MTHLQHNKMKKAADFFNALIPSYARGLLIFAVIYNSFVYYFCRFVTQNRTHYLLDSWIDRQIPVLPWTVLIYFGCYLFWIANYLLCSHFSKEQARRFLGAEILGKTVCFLFYLLLPTTINRPDITSSGFCSDLMRLLYAMDAPDNLLPSIHCFVSWLCYIGMRKDCRYPLLYRIFSMIFAMMVCISTLTTKQHVIADVFVGVALAELCFFVMGKAIKSQ